MLQSTKDKLSKIALGRPSAFKGRRHSQEAKIKMSLAARARKNNFLGKKHREDTKKKMSIAKKGIPSPRKGLSWASPETLHKMSLAQKKRYADRPPRIRPKPRGRLYRIWRRAVLERDNYICFWCDETSKSLCAHHVLSWIKYPEYRFNINNGVTLCGKCHNKIHGKERTKNEV
jgi:5-methylcytosine-specific restriction endonuclease McrA